MGWRSLSNDLSDLSDLSCVAIFAFNLSATCPGRGTESGRDGEFDNSYRLTTTGRLENASDAYYLAFGAQNASEMRPTRRNGVFESWRDGVRANCEDDERTMAGV
jgi:hypothetical protein